jgi:Fe-S oxidoreductase
LIKSKRRRVTKNSSGYNLFALVDGLEKGLLDLPRLFIGSEGTLGITLEVKIKLVLKPTQTITALLYFKELHEIGEAVNDLLHLEPSALEMMDSNAMNLVGRAANGIPEEAQALLLMEFDQGNLEEQITQAKRLCDRYTLCGTMAVAREKEEQADLWKIRKAIYPTLYRYDTQKKPVNFADDVVVPAKRLSELIHYLDAFFKELRVPVAIYGHIGNGNAHINPLLDVNNPEDFEKMVTIAREVHRIVIENFEGSICGEHGDGRVRAEFVKALYGEDLFNLFKATKRILDPQNILNPGVKISDTPFTQSIDFERLSKPCATCGRCNSVCPVYDVTQEESNAARGWFHILTDPAYSYEQAGRVVEACLNCKSCREVCPAGLDVSALVLEKREEHPNPVTGLLAFLQSRPQLLGRLVKLAGITQPLWDQPMGRWLLEKMSLLILSPISPTARIPREMILPRFARRTLRERYRHLTEEEGHKNSLAYFHGCAANYFQDGVGDALLDLLHHHGIQPVLPRQRCSGTPIQTYGHKRQLREAARFNLASLSRYEKVITGCASCTLMLKDYTQLFPDGPEAGQARRLSERVTHITQFLLHDVDLKPMPHPAHVKERVVTYHSSCHLRVAGISKEPRELIRRLPGIRFVEMQDADRCAGGAGTFVVKNYDLSQQIFERKRKGIQESGAEIVATSCPACMIQLQNGLKGGRRVQHVVQLLAEIYGLPSASADVGGRVR